MSPEDEPVEFVAFVLGDEEGSVSLVVLGPWDAAAKGLDALDLLAAEWRGESEMGPLRVRTMLSPDVLDDLDAAAGDLLAGRKPSRTCEQGHGQHLWESRDRDSRLGLLLAPDAEVCRAVQMTGIHGWPTFVVPLDRPFAEVGRVLAEGVAAVRSTFPRRTTDLPGGVTERR